LFEVPAKVVYVFNEYPEHHFARVPLTRAKAAQVLSKALQLDIGLERLRERLGIPLGTPDDCVRVLEKYVEAGARYFILAPLTRPEEFLKVAQFCVDLVIPGLS
jgi:alkanesulfonate monooxygenase SsuD/methylene tetrahydromethanopterin reductase-like flavin-dependent oxidoreductase (luciferase family)